MANKVFISFRFKDGNYYKEKLEEKFKNNRDVINCSESIDRSQMTESTIKKYLYDKLRTTSVTIVILTPESINYKKDLFGNIDDWLYDELRYSLDDREGNRSNAIIAVYTPEAKKYVIESNDLDNTTTIKNFNNLVRKNMFNIKQAYKYDKTSKYYNSNYDHYCSLISWEDFINNPNKYINIAIEKRDNINHYEIIKRIQTDTRYYW